MNRIFNKIIKKIFGLVRHYVILLRSKEVKLSVGSSAINQNGDWLITDINTLDLTKRNDWFWNLLFFKVNVIFAEHVWEHLNDNDTELANNNCFNFLKRGGKMRIAVPDGFHPDKSYIEQVKPGGEGPGAEDHKILYNYKSMQGRLEKVGFQLNFLEYWDEEGEFHSVEWDSDSGKVRRSKNHDQRNKDAVLNYTSLIVDAIKP